MRTITQFMIATFLALFLAIGSVYADGSISGRVWLDANANGIQDLGETGLEGATVRLFTSPGGPQVGVDFLTLAAGTYSFDGVANGNYYVEFTVPGGYFFSAKDQGGDDGFDSDADPADGKTEEITVADNATINVDAGMFEKGSIGDIVWKDLDGDGIQDGGGETGLDGATVKLYDTSNNLIATAPVTDADGDYLFSNVLPGDYYIEFTKPAGYFFSPKDVIGTESTDSDADVDTGKTGTITITSGLDLTDVDAGMFEKGSIGDIVWKDLDGDGIQDGGGETGLDGATVKLYDTSNNLIATAPVTDGDGDYLFSDVLPGDYYIEFTKPAGYYFSPKDVAGTEATDSDADVTTGKTGTITITSGLDLDNVDAGMIQYGSIGDLVWNDINADGIQDIGETGLEGATVKLYKTNNVLVATAPLTDADGGYVFSNVELGSYYVKFTAPAGYYISPKDMGGNDETDSDPIITTGKTITLTITNGLDITDVDAGMYKMGKIGDLVWNDLDGDGLQDVGEPGLTGVSVKLYKADGTTLLATTTTDANGNYSFLPTAPTGGYVVKFTAPSGYYLSPKDVVGTEATDSDADPSTGKTAGMTINANDEVLTVDAGMYKKGSLGNRAWSDVNNNGLLDAGEAGFAGVVVRLYKSSAPAVVLASKVTSSTGYFSFTSLTPGSYILEYVLPTGGYTFSPQNQGTDEESDSDVDQLTGKVTVAVTSGEIIINQDAGIYFLPGNGGSIGNLVWVDLNANGTQDVGEVGLAGVTVTLYKANGTTFVASKKTDANGAYAFSALVPGSYVVRFTKPSGYYLSPKDVVGNEATDSDADPSTGKTAVVVVAIGSANSDVDAGMFKKGTIGDRVWKDTNHDGFQNNAETGFSGVQIKLYNAATDALVAAKVASSSGYFSFTGVTPGSYYLKVMLPAGGYEFTTPNLGGAPSEAIDSDVDANGVTAAITVTSGLTISDQDAGIWFDPGAACSIGNLVWHDQNGDGIKDVSEPGLAGARVYLYRSNGTTLVTSKTTDANGAYSFEMLTAGDYMVKFTAPSGYYLSPSTGDLDDATNSDANPATGKTIVIVLENSNNFTYIDAGMYKKGTIGDRAWKDTDMDGFQGATETGFSGIIVKLYRTAGIEDDVLVGTKTTSSTGYFTFTGLAPASDYYLKYELPVGGYVFTSMGPVGGINESSDSDVDEISGETDLITLTSGQVIKDQDAGIYLDAGSACSIGDLVWHDLNADGIYDSDTESGISGVTVRLYASNGTTLLATTTTNSDGVYRFTMLTAGDYFVKFTRPTSYYFSPKDIGDESTDSDADVTTGMTAVITLAAGATNEDIDAGMYKTVYLGNRAWKDTNGDGVEVSSEPGFSGISVHLYQVIEDEDDLIVGTKITGSTGYFSFTGIVPGTYYLVYDLPANYEFTVQDAGGNLNDYHDSDVDSDGKTTPGTVTSGMLITYWDAGYVLAGPVAPEVKNPFKSNNLSIDGAGKMVTEFNAYPNPFSRLLNISFNVNQDTPVKIAIIDMTGRTVDVVTERTFESGQHIIQYTNESLKAGIYFMRISHNGGSDVKRIVVSD